MYNIKVDYWECPECGHTKRLRSNPNLPNGEQRMYCHSCLQYRIFKKFKEGFI